jgi:hypothetical protein
MLSSGTGLTRCDLQIRMWTKVSLSVTCPRLRAHKHNESTMHPRQWYSSWSIISGVYRFAHTIRKVTLLCRHEFPSYGRRPAGQPPLELLKMPLALVTAPTSAVSPMITPSPKGQLSYP